MNELTTLAYRLSRRTYEFFLRHLLRSRGRLPFAFWQFLWKMYWTLFWRREQMEETRQLGEKLPDAIAGSERALLIESIVAEAPFAKLLEVGCAYGQNFTTLAPLMPKSAFLGIDADPRIVAAGQQTLLKEGCANAFLIEGDFSRLASFNEKSFEIVVSSAFLLYVPPERIEEAVANMFRVCSRTLVFLEQHTEAEGEKARLGIYVPRPGGNSGYWVRNYRTLLKSMYPQVDVNLQRIPQPRWPGESWKELGHIIIAGSRNTR